MASNGGSGSSGEGNTIPPPSPIPVMYLAHEDWSPRYESTFFTVKIDGYEHYTSELPPSLPTSNVIGGKTGLPAYYYKITVLCGHQRRTVLRRYSQFEWLYKSLPRSITHYDEPLFLPPKSPPKLLRLFCQPPNDDAFARKRMEQLRDFLRDALMRRGAAQHIAVAQFLELEELAR